MDQQDQQRKEQENQNQAVVDHVFAEQSSRYRPSYHYKWKNFIQNLILGSLVGVWLFVIIYTRRHKIENPPLYSVVTKRKIDRPLKLILFGDSLIQKPAEKYGLQTKIEDRLPGFIVVNSGKNGQHIAELQSRVAKDVLTKNPDVVFLFWDSDMSAQPVSYLMTESFQRNYSRTVTEVILAIKNVSHVIVSGPTVLSEGPLLNVARFLGRKPLLDVYVNLNKKICAETNVTYLDLHAPFVDAIPKRWMYYRWFLTADGEHGNHRGSVIIADALAEAIGVWLKDMNY